jgi:hypothetical protein
MASPSRRGRQDGGKQVAVLGHRFLIFLRNTFGRLAPIRGPGSAFDMASQKTTE